MNPADLGPWFASMKIVLGEEFPPLAQAHLLRDLELVPPDALLEEIVRCSLAVARGTFGPIDPGQVERRVLELRAWLSAAFLNRTWSPGGRRALALRGARSLLEAHRSSDLGSALMDASWIAARFDDGLVEPVLDAFRLLRDQPNWGGSHQLAAFYSAWLSTGPRLPVEGDELEMPRSVPAPADTTGAPRTRDARSIAFGAFAQALAGDEDLPSPSDVIAATRDLGRLGEGVARARAVIATLPAARASFLAWLDALLVAAPSASAPEVRSVGPGDVGRVDGLARMFLEQFLADVASGHVELPTATPTYQYVDMESERKDHIREAFASTLDGEPFTDHVGTDTGFVLVASELISTALRALKECSVPGRRRDELQAAATLGEALVLFGWRPVTSPRGDLLMLLEDRAALDGAAARRWALETRGWALEILSPLALAGSYLGEEPHTVWSDDTYDVLYTRPLGERVPGPLLPLLQALAMLRPHLDGLGEPRRSECLRTWREATAATADVVFSRHQTRIDDPGAAAAEWNSREAAEPRFIHHPPAYPYR
jgi:hypothetical protein